MIIRLNLSSRKRGGKLITIPKNVLVADEDRVRNLHLALLLKRLEYNVFVATSVHDLFRIAENILPHVIILDLKMPSIEGQNCLQKIRSIVSLRIVKVITVSDGTDLKSLEETLKKGANACLARPLNPTEVYRTVQKLTEAHPRQWPRLRVLFKVSAVSGKTGKTSFATMISEQGIFIRTMHPFPKGTRLKLSLDLPSAKPIALEGEVIYEVGYNKEVFKEPGMGVKFIGLDDGIRKGLKKFIEDQLTGDFDTELI